MLLSIKDTFPNAIFFGFTGTPIQDENKKKDSTTATVFGDELHRYSIADGIRDKNVLGFDPYKVLTFKDRDVRTEVALAEAKASSEQEAMNDPCKAEVFYEFMDSSQVPMAGYLDESGKKIKGIEDYIPESQYLSDEHTNKVVEDIAENWLTLSRNNKFHAIFATKRIQEAIEYYRLIKKKVPDLKVTCLFDPNIDNNEDGIYKEDGLVEVMEDYNKLYEKDFSLATHAAFKKDISFRLAHKEQYKWIEKTPEKELNLLIVVNQMLTGFDSKWVNTLYLDKTLEFESIIQAFSRTNRLFAKDEKPFGVIRYYRRPHTMEKNIAKAVKLYSGDKPLGLFVEKLDYNLRKLNETYYEISELFKNAGLPDFDKLPEEPAVKAKFASLFRDFNSYLDAAKVQGFRWDKAEYEFIDEDAGKKQVVNLDFDKQEFISLVQRYKELATPSDDFPKGEGDIPFDLVGYITEIDTGHIDTNYMNSRFEKYTKLIQQGASEESINSVLGELHKTFATLTQDEQKYANIFLNDFQSGDVYLHEGDTFRDYITMYQYQAKNDQIHRFADAFGLDEAKLRYMMGLNLKENNINEFGRFDELKKTIDKSKAKAYLEETQCCKLIMPKVNQESDKLLRKFILTGGFEL